jgi:hypothetical protein
MMVTIRRIYVECPMPKVATAWIACCWRASPLALGRHANKNASVLLHSLGIDNPSNFLVGCQPVADCYGVYLVS